MSLTNFPHGVTSFGAPILPGSSGTARSGNVFWVDSGVGSDSNDDASFDKPLATLDHAIGHCTANNGDIIYVKEGHAETYSAAASLVCDIAGVTIIGLGEGDDRPTFTFGTAVGADIDVTAVSVLFHNLHFKAGLDNLTAPIHVTGANFTLNKCEFEDPTDIEANIWILTTATADDFQMHSCFWNGYTAGNQTESVFRLVGANNAVIDDCIFKGGVATAVIEFHTTVCTSVFIHNNFFHTFNGANAVITDLSRNVVNTQGASLYLISDCYDLGAGCKFYGGSGLTVEKEVAATYTAAASDMVIAASDLTYTASLMETYSSDIAAATATIDTAASDLVVALSDTKTIGSNILVTKSNVEAILSTQLVDHSHLTIEHSNVKAIGSNLLITKSNVEAILSTQLVDHSHLTIEHSNVKAILSTQLVDHSHITIMHSNLSAVGSNMLVAKSNVEAILSTQLVDHSHLTIMHSNLSAVGSNMLVAKSNVEAILSTQLVDHSHMTVMKSLLDTINSDMKVDMPRTITIASDILIAKSNVEAILSTQLVDHSHITVNRSHIVVIDAIVDSILSMVLINHSQIENIYSHIILLSH